MTLYTLIFAVAAFTISAANELTLPVTTCKRGTEDYSSCLELAIKEAWPKFVSGLPEFNFPSLQPLFFEYLKFEFRNNQIYGEAICRNVTVNGLMDARFFAVKTYLLDNTFRLEFHALIPKVNVKEQCEGTGNIIGLRMVGNGYIDITMEQVKITCELIGHIVNDTWIVEHSRVVPIIQKGQVILEGFFDGNKELNDLIMTFINEYWPMLFRIVLPQMAGFVDELFTNMTNILFSKVSFSKIFP